MKEFFRKKSVRIGTVILSLALLVGLVFGCQALFDPLDNRMAPGVTIGGLDIGGMTRREAKDALRTAALETFLTQDMLVQLPKDTLSLAPYELGMELDLSEAVRTAFRYGRSKDSTVSEIGLLPYLTMNEDSIRMALDAYALTYDTDLTEAAYRMEGDMPDLSTAVAAEEIPVQTLVVTMGLPTAHLDVEEAFHLVMAEYDSAISACRSGTYGVRVEVADTEVPALPDLEAMYDEFLMAPTDDSLDMENYGVINGTYGYHFDREAAAAAVNSASYGETVAIPMVCFTPEIYGEGVYFRDLLGSCETKHNTNENRNNNLRLLCAAIDGMVMQPGEEFSYNTVVGERTAERGYLPAPAYSGSRLVDATGGGVCQGSSTLYNCVLIADLEVTNRVCHGAVINYLPLGLDATVNWGTTDFCFRNSSHFPILLKAEVSDGYVKMQILGTDEKDYYVVLDARSWTEGDITYANSYSCKYNKETDELISRDRIAHSIYYKTKG